METNCAPFIADLFFYCYDSVSDQTQKRPVLIAFNSSCRYIDDMFLLNNQECYKDTAEIYPKEVIPF